MFLKTEGQSYEGLARSGAPLHVPDLGHGWGCALAKAQEPRMTGEMPQVAQMLVAHSALRPPGGPEPRVPCRGREVPSASI